MRIVSVLATSFVVAAHAEVSGNSSCCTCQDCDGCAAVLGVAGGRRLSAAAGLQRAAADCCSICRGLAARRAPVARAASAPRATGTASPLKSFNREQVVHAPRSPVIRGNGPLPAAPVEPVTRTAPDEAIDQKAIQRFENFGIIEPIQNLGTFCWDPAGLSKKVFSEVTSEDVAHGLRQQEKQPHQVMPLSSISLPVIFPSLPPQIVVNTFPYDAGFAVPLHVAKERGVDLRTVDFILGGSALNILANRRVQRINKQDDIKYLVQKCPITGIVVVAKSKMYSTDYASEGFQFERLLTGRPLDDMSDGKHFESLQLIKVAGYRVLFAAEVDGIDADGAPVELRSSTMKSYRASPRAMKTMFQMLSSGSETLIQADRHGQLMHDLSASTFNDVVWMHSASYLATAGGNIAETLRTLKRAEIPTDAPTELDFQKGNIILTPCPTRDLLPSKAVLQELLGPSNPARLDQAESMEVLRGRMERIARGAEAERAAEVARLKLRERAAALAIKSKVSAAEADAEAREGKLFLAPLVFFFLTASFSALLPWHSICYILTAVRSRVGCARCCRGSSVMSGQEPLMGP